MRWHKIAGGLCAFFGFLLLTGGTLMLGVMAWYNIKYGQIEFSGEEGRALDQIALTWQNVVLCICYVIGGLSGLAAAVSWFNQRKLHGVLFTVLMISIQVVATSLRSTH